MNDNGTDIFEGTLDALDGIAEGTGLNVKKAGELVDEEDANPTNEQELREQINAIREELVGRNQTHQKVAKLSNWSRIELENVIKQDGWIYEDEMIALIRTEKLKLLAEVRERVIGENEPEFNTPKPELGNMARNRLREAQADLLNKLEATQ